MNTRLPESKCPGCNSKLDGVSGPGNFVPRKGDISVCLYCGTISQFDKNLKLKPCDEKKITAEAKAAASRIKEWIVEIHKNETRH